MRVLLTSALLGSLGAGTLAASPPGAASPAITASASVPAVAGRPAVPTRGAYFGASVSGRPELPVRTSVLNLEHSLGRKLSVHRLYDVWDDDQPGGTTSWTISQGRTPVLSINTSRRNGTVVRWRDIAAGREDARIRAQALGLKALNAPLFVSLHHEPENDPAHGSAAEYVAAWRHYVSVFRAVGVTNVSFTWILMAWTFDRPAAADLYYPGDDVIDWVAADGYNWYGTDAGKTWRPLGEALAAFNTWNLRRAKPMMVAEYGTLEDPAVVGRKGAWITQAATAIKAMPKIKAVLYFHAPVVHPWWVDSSASALSAFAAMGRDQYFRPAGTSTAPRSVADFDGNGSTDVAVYRPSNGGWYIRGGTGATWGSPTDVPVPADYNGDRRTDVAVWRPTDGRWYRPTAPSVAFGVPGDVPVPGDYNGDGRADLAVWRPATGTWWIFGVGTVHWGVPGDIPVPADYNGDGRTDVALWRPTTGMWWILGASTVHYGVPGDVPVPADYNGDRLTDLALFRPSSGSWFLLGSAVRQLGGAGDVPVPGDYDADGANDIAVFTPATGRWLLAGSTNPIWGTVGDKTLPLPAAVRTLSRY